MQKVEWDRWDWRSVSGPVSGRKGRIYNAGLFGSGSTVDPVLVAGYRLSPVSGRKGRIYNAGLFGSGSTVDPVLVAGYRLSPVSGRKGRIYNAGVFGSGSTVDPVLARDTIYLWTLPTGERTRGEGYSPTRPNSGNSSTQGQRATPDTIVQ